VSRFVRRRSGAGAQRGWSCDPVGAPIDVCKDQRPVSLERLLVRRIGAAFRKRRQGHPRTGTHPKHRAVAR
jgi:hypothetical protein